MFSTKSVNGEGSRVRLLQLSRTSCVCFPPTIINLFIALACLALTFYCTRLALAMQADSAAMHQTTENLSVDNIRLRVMLTHVKEELDALKSAHRPAKPTTTP